MPIAITLTQIQENLDSVEVIGTLKFTGSYPAGGDTIDWTTVSGNATPNGRIFTPQGLPVACQINGSGLYGYGYKVGTALNNATVVVADIANAGVLATGAYPAGVTGDLNIFFDAAFPKLL